MKHTTEILHWYTGGGATLEETNAALRSAGAGFYLDPAKNALTEAEKRSTTVGYYPAQANGFGLLDTGTGSLDKAEVRSGQLAHTDCGDMYALFYIAGKVYQVRGRELTEVREPERGTPALPKTPDLSRRSELAGQTAVQACRTGDFQVTYDENGYAVKATRLEG